MRITFKVLVRVFAFLGVIFIVLTLLFVALILAISNQLGDDYPPDGPTPRPVRIDTSSLSVEHCSKGVVIMHPETLPSLVRDCEALVDIKTFLRADPPLAWSPAARIESWEGIEVGRLGDSESWVVKGLRLPGRGLFSSIPPGISRLAGLLELDLSDNQLDGDIPPELGKLKSLEFLNLSENRLTGEIPSELGSLSNLSLLELSGNELTGTIPEGLLPSDERPFRLYVEDTQLEGCIPPESESYVTSGPSVDDGSSGASYELEVCEE